MRRLAGAPFAGHRIIAFDDEAAGMQAARWLIANASQATPALATSKSSVILGACVAGLGLALLPDLVVEGRALTAVRPDVLSLDVWLIVHPDVNRAARVRAVVEAIVQCAAMRLPQ